MSFNGSGTFLINTAGQPVVAGTVISSTAFNALTADLATGLSTVITKDGQTTVTANIPMSTYKFTGLGVGSAATDSANLSQVQSTVTKLLNSVSGADTITATASPTLAAYAAGQMFYFVAAGDNTTSVTLNIDALGAKAVTRDGSTALVAADIKSGEVIVVVYDGTRFQVVSQLNSAGDARFANVSIASSLYVGGVSTFVGNAGFSANVSIASALSVGGVAAITGATTIGGNLTLSGGTANGVAYLNGSKVVTSGSALTFDGTNFATTGNSRASGQFLAGSTGAATPDFSFIADNTLGIFRAPNAIGFSIAGSESMRLTSTGLGIGTSSPGYKLTVAGASGSAVVNLLESGVRSWGIRAGGTATNTFDIADFTASATRLTIDSSGNLGIGTSSPAAKLEIYNASVNATFAANTLSTWRVAQIRNDGTANANNAAGIAFVGRTDVQPAGIVGIQSTTGGGVASLAFLTVSSNTTSESMRLDSSGNLGLGVTPSVWQSGVKAFQNGAGALYTINTVQQRLSLNAYRDSAGTMRYINSSINAAEFRMGEGDGSFQFHTAASGTAGNTISFTQAMTLDASGRLLVGVTSASGNAALQVKGATSGYARLEGTSSTLFAGDAGQLISGAAAADSAIRAEGALLFAAGGGTERARITSGGYSKFSNDGTYVGSTGAYHELKVTGAAGDWTTIVSNAATTGANAYGVSIRFTGSTPNNTGNEFIQCLDATATRFAFRSNGGLANYSANDVNLSDERTKKDIVPLGSMWDKFKAIEIVAFKYKDQTHEDNNIGVIAQQVESVAPEFVDVDGFGDTPEDGVPLKTIYTTDMYHAAIKALQEAMARIEQLEAKFAALESK